MVICMSRGVKGAIILGVAFTTVRINHTRNLSLERMRCITTSGPALSGSDDPNASRRQMSQCECVVDSSYMHIASFGIPVAARRPESSLLSAACHSCCCVQIIAWIPGHGASYLGKTSNVPGGIGNTGPARWDYFKKACHPAPQPSPQIYDLSCTHPCAATIGPIIELQAGFLPAIMQDVRPA